MMKKFSILMLAIVAMLASCSQEDTLQTEAEDTLQAVTITASLPEVATLAPAATRAITATDDDDATRCLMQLVEEGVAQEVQEGTISNGSCSFTVTLNPTKQYQLMFWADNEKYTADAAQGLEKMTANASSANASPVGIAYAGTATWGGSELAPSINVDLKHVVSKLTLRTTEAVTGGKNYSLKIPTTYTAYDVLSGTLLEPSADGTTYNYTVPAGGVAKGGNLFSIYLLAGSETQKLTLTNDGADFEIANVPLAPNKHTILKGNVQNAGHINVTFTATVVDEWDSEETKYIIPGDAVEITPENCSNISGDGNYVVSGTFNNQITITSGSPTIYLEGANINVSSSNAINITGGNPTVHVVGAKNSISSDDGAGIFVAEGSSVTIMGSSRDDQLTVTGGSDGCAIGGYMNDFKGVPCGDINISTVTIVAYPGNGAIQPGIGGIGADCGRITITDAKVTAYGMNGYDWNAPAIGTGMDYITSGTIPTITISDNSEVHAHRGLYSGRPSTADYIGNVGNSFQTPSATGIQVGTGGSITNSTIYCYSGTGNIVDKIMEYDASGNGTQQ